MNSFGMVAAIVALVFVSVRYGLGKGRKSADTKDEKDKEQTK